MSHFLSFIIPCYNCADIVGEAIESIYQQTLDFPFEVVCTDDGSEDSTREVLSYYKNKHSNLNVHHHGQNMGVYGGAIAANTCVANSKGDLIFRLDADNILAPDSVSKLIQLIDETGYDGAAVAELRYFEGSKGNYRHSHSWFYEAPNNICDISHIISTTRTPAASGNYLYTRKSFDRVGGYPNVGLDSLGFGFRQHATGGKIAILPGTFYWHRLSGNSCWVHDEKRGVNGKYGATIFREFPELFTDETNRFLASPDCEKDFFKHHKSGRFKAVSKQSLDYLFQGYREQRDQKYSEAMNSFSRAINSGCKHWKVVWCLSQVAYKAGNMNLAEQAAEAVTELEPNFAEATELLQQIRYKLEGQINTSNQSLNKFPSQNNDVNLVSEDLKQKYTQVLKERIKQLGAVVTVSNSKAEAAWIKNRNNIQQLILNEDVNNFLNWDIIVNTMFHEAKIEELKYLQNLSDCNRWQKAIQESFIGNPKPYPAYPESSGNLIHHAYSLAQLEQIGKCRIEQLPEIIEFGGGYGSMCRLAFQLGFKGRYIIYDLPELTALQEYFLNCIGLENYINYNVTSDAPTAIVLLSDINKLKKQLNYKTAGYAFIATWSISEVPLELRNRVFNHVSGAGYYLIAYQDQFGMVDNSNYFSSLTEGRPYFIWKRYPIEHLPGNYYLIGCNKSLHINQRDINESQSKGKPWNLRYKKSAQLSSETNNSNYPAQVAEIGCKESLYITNPDSNESGAPHSASSISGVIFSKDRAMQLDATIRSFLLNCKDLHLVNLKVIYKVSNSDHKESYNKLIKEYKFIEFIKEENFRKQLLSNIVSPKHILFLVDDNIFVRDFYLFEITNALQEHPDALGFSLRLGKNINFHYPSSSKEMIPPFIKVTEKILKYDWTNNIKYFGYPLEVSSSVYRTDDILPLLTKLDFQNPNTLEAEIAQRKDTFINKKKLLCFQQSITFCNPINIVQDVFPSNRSGKKGELSPDSLTRMFNAGYRIDVTKFLNFIPSSCHQEVQLEFIKSDLKSSALRPTVSIYMAVYNSEKYIAQTLDSILSQTLKNFEIVIANDGSTDNSTEILKRYEKADNRIRVLRLSHVGVVEARNEAIKHCNPNSKYLMNHDSDDISSPTKLARLVEYLETHPEIAIVGCFAEYFDDEGNFKGQPSLEHLPKRIRQTFCEVNSMIHSASLIRRQVFEKIGHYSKDFPVSQDYDFFARALMAGFELANIPEVLHRIRLHPDSIGGKHANAQKIFSDKIRENYKSNSNIFDNQDNRPLEQQIKYEEMATKVKSPNVKKPNCRHNKPLRILHTVELYSPHIGGAEQVVQQLSERLAKRGHDVTVATTKLTERTFNRLNGVQIEEFDIGGTIAHGFVGNDIERYQQFLIQYPADIMMNYAAQQWATDLAFDSLASTKNRRVNIIAPCGYSALSNSQTLQIPEFEEYFRKTLPTYLPQYDAAVYHSGRYQDYEYALNHGFNNSVIIPNGVCEEEFMQTPKISFRNKYQITTKFIGLCVANFYRGKGQDKIIECVRQMNRSDFTIVLIGKEGGELNNLYQSAIGLNIKFCIGINREDTLAAYNEADIFLFGSEKECSPLVIVEAKASRTPFVSTDCGNVREWKGGVVCAPEKMAFYANRILDDQIIHKSLAEDGWKEWKEKLTWESIVDKYEQLYSKLYFEKFKLRHTSILSPLSIAQFQCT